MKRIVLLVTFLCCFVVSQASALELTDKIALDGYAKYILAFEGTDTERSSGGVEAFTVEVNTRYLFKAELGATYDNLFRLAGNFQTKEFFEDVYGGTGELYLSKLVDLPVNTGIELEYYETKDRTGDVTDQFFGGGFVVRLP